VTPARDWIRSTTRFLAILFVMSLVTLVQSFVVIKLVCLGLFLAAALIEVTVRGKIATYPRILSFYFFIALAGVVWSVVGWLNEDNMRAGVFDALRLYVAWSIAFAVIYSLLRSQPSLEVFHKAMVAAGLAIAVLNLVALYDYGTGSIPDSIRQELQLNVGVHEGYIHFASNSVGSLFLVAPYLLSLQFRKDAARLNTPLTKLSTILALVVVALSGRRALWLVVALTPAIVLLLSLLTGTLGLLKTMTRRVLAVCSLAPVLVLLVLAGGWSDLIPSQLEEYGTVRHLQSAFGSEDERTIQSGYLIAGFLRSPIIGSGFGAYADYLRSEQRPWTYELTYYQMLFNIGVVGVAFLASLVMTYLVLVLSLLRRFRAHSATPFGLLVAFCSILIGAHSNPYLGSFALLFFIGLLPYLSTFRRGFEPSEG